MNSEYSVDKIHNTMLENIDNAFLNYGRSARKSNASKTLITSRGKN